MRASPSRIKTFGDCANSYKYRYVLELEGDTYNAFTVVGSVFHYAAEVYEQYDCDIDLAVKTLRYYWNHLDELGLRIDAYPPRTSHQGLEDHAVDMLERYHQLAPWKGGELIGTEITFDVPLGRHVLRGVIDKLFARPQVQELQIIDYKTGYKVPKKLKFNIQFTSYMYASSRPEFWEQVPGYEHSYEQFKDYKRVGQWYHARNNKMFNAGYRDDSDYRRLLLAVDQMEASIKNDIYPLTIEGEVCGWCPWVEICGTEVESPNQDLTE